MAGFFSKLKNALDTVFGDYSQVDDDFFEELTDVLVMSDVGAETATSIVEKVREKSLEEHVKNPDKVRSMLVEEISERMKNDPSVYDFLNDKCVILVTGVNGVGKTTTIGKLALLLKNKGKRVLMCAADTFRAAAIEQLEVWAGRTGCELIRQDEGSDPASVVYDGINAMKARNADILIVDTAGRLHNKKNLMDELAKIDRILKREMPDVRKEVLLVLDATTGQNALSQADEFSKACGITGLVMTKMDSSAKGGVAIAVCDRIDVPVMYVGVGEKAEDLREFDAEFFVKELVGVN
ncbi:MAG: signal recognition particle-docking protein FtsY [Eubacteriales bacterium]|nr:signal recognition particle-docking protein FtsY [Eubacteriales bacterium]